jgi:DNA-binding transcriptional LysR family regulator
MNNLNDIVIFIQVVETGGMSSAAAALRMSPSRVSRRLRALEEAMGVQLISRSTRHISLTEAGDAFYKKCAPAMAILHTAQSDTASISDAPRGTLRVHSAVGVGQGLVTEAAAAFKRDYPDIAIDLYIDSDRENLMRDGYDVVIKTSDVTDSSLVSHDLGPLRHIIVASPEYLQRAGRPQTPHDLVNHNCLLQYGRRPAADWHFIGPAKNYTVRVSGSFRSTNAVALCKAAAMGVGIARVPEYVLYGQPDGEKLEIIFDSCVAIDREVKAFHPRSQHLPAKVKIFLNYLREADERRLEATAHLKVG